MRDEIKKETEEKLVDWVKEELLNIMMVLRYKMERKIYMDELAVLREELDQPVKGLAMATLCLGLIRCFQLTGNVNFQKNNFYTKIIQHITLNFENQKSRESIVELSKQITNSVT